MKCECHKYERTGGICFLLGAIIIFAAVIYEFPKNTVMKRQDHLEMKVNGWINTHNKLYKHELRIQENKKWGRK